MYIYIYIYERPCNGCNINQIKLRAFFQGMSVTQTDKPNFDSVHLYKRFTYMLKDTTKPRLHSCEFPRTFSYFFCFFNLDYQLHGPRSFSMPSSPIFLFPLGSTTFLGSMNELLVNVGNTPKSPMDF